MTGQVKKATGKAVVDLVNRQGVANKFPFRSYIYAIELRAAFSFGWSYFFFIHSFIHSLVAVHIDRDITVQSTEIQYL